MIGSFPVQTVFPVRMFAPGPRLSSAAGRAYDSRNRRVRMATVTPELRHEIERSGNQPVRLSDPETQNEYVILKAEIYERLQALVAGQMSIDEQRAILR